MPFDFQSSNCTLWSGVTPSQSRLSRDTFRNVGKLTRDLWEMWRNHPWKIEDLPRSRKHFRDDPIPKKKRITTQSRKGNISFLLFNFDMKDIKPYSFYLRISFQNNPQKKGLKGHTKKKKKCQRHTIHPSIHHAMVSSPRNKLCVSPAPTVFGFNSTIFRFQPLRGLRQRTRVFCGWDSMILWPKKFQEKKSQRILPTLTTNKKTAWKNMIFSLFFESTCQI